MTITNDSATTPDPAPIDGAGDRPGTSAISVRDEARRRARRRRRWRTAALLVGVPVLVAAVTIGVLRLMSPHAYSGTVLQAPTRAPSMEGLTFADGSPVDVESFRGDVVVVFFGYTHCPDVCPTTLATLADAADRVDDDRMHVLFVSLDPERDDLERLGDYVTTFDPSFLAATGPADDVDRVASTYGIFHARGGDTPDGGYTVDHTATLMGIDTDGRLRIVWPPEIDAESLAADLDELL
jgi:protein SCO1/2